MTIEPASSSRKGLLALALIGLLPACGGSSGSRPNPLPSATPTPCTQSVLQSASGPLPAQTLGAIGFTSAVAGRADVTVDWTLATSPIGVYVVPAAPACDIDSFNARTCNFLATSDPSAVKPRRISANTTTGGIYQVLVANYGSDDESVSGQVVLSLGPCPAFGAAGPAAAGRGADPEPLPELRVKTPLR